MRYPFRHATLLDPAQAELQVRLEVLGEGELIQKMSSKSWHRRTGTVE